jgi:TPR repeat protein
MIKGAYVLLGATMAAAPALAFDAAHLAQVMAGRDCPKCDLSKADLDHIDLAGADLRGANFTGANLRAADLRGVDLTDVILTDAILHGAILRAALLDGAEMSNVLAAGADLRGAELNSVILAGADFYMADFSGASFYEVDLSEAKSTISTATFTGAYFCKVTLAEGFTPGGDFCEDPAPTSEVAAADPVVETPAPETEIETVTDIETETETGVVPAAEDFGKADAVTEVTPAPEVTPETPADTVDLAALMAKANAHYGAAEYDAAFPLYKQLAEAGQPEAYVWLASLYRAGLGTPQDTEQGLRWYREAAALGDSFAIERVAEITAETEAEAATAAALAQFTVEELLGYAATKLNEGDRTLAIRTYQVAADQGSAEAWYKLGVLAEDYEPQNPKNIKALEYWQNAADLEYLDAKVRLAQSYRRGDFGTQKHIDKAIAMLIKASDQGSVGAASELGYLYASDDVPTNHVESFKWLKKAAELGDVNAASWIGYYYDAGQGTERNLEQSLVWHRKAAEGGHEYSMGRIPDLEAEFEAAQK